MRQHRRWLPGVVQPYLLIFPGLIMNKIPALLDFSENILGALCVVILAVMFGLGVTEVFFRYVVEMSRSFPSELIRYLFVWSVALGSAVAMRKNSHAAIEMFVGWLPERVGRWVLVGGWEVLGVVFETLSVKGLVLVMK